MIYLINFEIKGFKSRNYVYIAEILFNYYNTCIEDLNGKRTLLLIRYHLISTSVSGPLRDPATLASSVER